MKIKYLFLLGAGLAFNSSSYAQSQIFAQDAIRFSEFNYGSTSRIKGIGNAQTAIGGDLSSISGNPAGIGFFTRSELSFTPEFNNSKSNSLFFGSNKSDTRSSGNLNNASVVFHSRINTPKGADKSKGWLSFNFGASFNRTNNFYQNVYYAGRNGSSSITDYYALLANNSNNIINNRVQLPGGTLENAAYNQYLIDSVGKEPNGRFAYFDSNVGTGVDQSRIVQTTGGQSEFNLAFGANYSNKFYLGASLGITSLRYNSISTFTENGQELYNYNTTFSSDYNRDQTTKGNGINLKAGFIYKPDDFVRIGATVSTPTWYSIDDNTFEGIATAYRNSDTYKEDGTNYESSYNLRTPWKVSGGLAFFIKQFGFISGDIDYVDYTSTHLSGYDGSQNDNEYIRTLYKSAVNARVGAEARVAGSFFLRGGYGFQGSPRKDIMSNTKTASGGLGYRFGNYYLDATYTHITRSTTDVAYAVDGLPVPTANLKNKYDNVFLTLGIRF